MNRIFFTLLAALLLPGTLPRTSCAQQPPATINVQAAPAELFDTARKAYDQGDLSRAAALYEQLLAEGCRTPEVHFNLGNTRFRQGETGQAILHFKQALRLNPRDHDIKANLRFALENAGALVPKAHLLHTFTQQATGREWLLLAGLFWCLGFLMLMARLLLPAQRPALNRAALLLALAFGVTLAAALYQFRLRHVPEAVVTGKGVSALSAPLAGSTPLFKLPEGSVVRVTEQSGEWLHIAAGPQSGWLQRTICQPVD